MNIFYNPNKFFLGGKRTEVHTMTKEAYSFKIFKN